MDLDRLSSHVPMPWGQVDTDVFAAWGQWVGGVGSVAAVVGLVITTARETRRRRRDAEDQLAARARTVTAHVEQTSGYLEVGGRKFPQSLGLQVVVQNHGTGPILDVMLEDAEVTVGVETYTGWYIHEDHCHVAVPVATVIGPGEDGSVVGLKFQDTPDDVRPDAEDRYTITVSFTDTDGLRWRRSGHVVNRVLNEGP